MDTQVSDSLQNATVKLKAKADVIANPSLNTDAKTSSNSQDINPVISSFFGIDNPNSSQIEKLKDIQEFCSNKTEGKNESIINTLRDIRYRLGAQPISSSQIDHIHRYVKLRLQASIFNDQAKAMEL